MAWNYRYAWFNWHFQVSDADLLMELLLKYLRKNPKQYTKLQKAQILKEEEKKLRSKQVQLLDFLLWDQVLSEYHHGKSVPPSMAAYALFLLIRGEAKFFCPKKKAFIREGPELTQEQAKTILDDLCQSEYVRAEYQYLKTKPKQKQERKPVIAGHFISCILEG